ncbi:MAG: hypothetical protein ACFCGT_11030, partial [Sandaracinaceae bacterium]
MVETPTDTVLGALHRLLVDARAGGQAKVDALVALAQRTVRVVPWPGGVEGWRTLVNSEGMAALPVFTDDDEVQEAARRFGWLEPDGTCGSREIGTRAAFSYAREHDLSYVIIDIASAHRLEVGRDEFAPLLTNAARRDSSGPFAAAGKGSERLIQSVRPTPAPGTPLTRPEEEPYAAADRPAFTPEPAAPGEAPGSGVGEPTVAGDPPLETVGRAAPVLGELPAAPRPPGVPAPPGPPR